MKYFVEVVKFDSGESDIDNEVVKRVGPMSEHRADRVDDGLNINLNHNDFYTRIVPEEK